jgi:hypothetical protein
MNMKKQDRLLDLGIRDQFMAFKKDIIRRVQAIPHSAMNEQNKRLSFRTAYKLLGDVIRKTCSDPRIVPATLNLSDTPGKK